MSFSEFYQRSINEPEKFWAEQARRIDWQTPFTQTLDHSNPPFARWFCEGRTNLCHNAIDRWLEKQPEALALIAVSSETEEERTFTFRQLHDEVNAVASMLRSLGVQRGDRVLVYMPMIAEAHITLLACARIGAIHSVVFGGFASHSVAARIDDAKPVLIVSADAGARGGKIIPYKKLLDDAISQAQHQPRHVLLVDRGLAKMARVSGRDVDFASLRHQHIGARVPVAWLESNETSCILYTSGTTGKPKGVQRDVGGYAVALATSMDTIFGGKAGGVFFCASDIGWVVGHSYIVYAPLLAGMATIVYEGLPIWPDCGVWWKIVEKYQVSRMFSAPTAIRVLKKFPTAEIRKHDLSSLEVLYLAGEPLDEPTASWVSNTLDVPVIDNYWQTESGWPIMAIARGLDDRPTRLGSPGVPMYGYNVQLLNEVTGEPCGVNEPKKIMGILQGEALMNDASGLVSLKFAVAVAMGTMIFTVGGATVEFMKVAIGGILAGFVVSWLYGRSLRFLSRWGGDEPATQIVLLFLLPFASYLIAEHIGVSGILAAVAAGMTITRSGVMRRAPLAMRLRANSTWAMLEFVFNGMVFLLLGLQLPGILETSLMAAEIDPNVEIWMLFTDIILIYAALMLVRFGWLWTMKKFSNRFLKKKPMEFGSWTTREILIASFAGVRGAITLAGVLSIPLLLPDGNVFPARYELVFLAAGVILFSLFVGVVMLPILLQHIEVADHSQQLKEERIARAATAEVAIVAIQKMEERLAADTEENIDNQLLTEVSSRVIGNLRRRADGRNDVESSILEENLERRFRLAALRSERAELYHLRATREISNETLQKLLHDLDLLEALLIEENQ